jgi:DNA processing protein
MEKYYPWFFLKTVPGIGNHIFKRLINSFNSPEQVLDATKEDLLKIGGLTPRLFSALRLHKMPEWVEKDLIVADKKNYRILTMLDPEYPALLLEIPDPPPFLYVYGSLHNPVNGIAIVGSRNATNYGISATKQLCSSLASNNVTVVSGMARGIDTAAHEGALIGKGKTIAILGSGLERIYPAENRGLFQKIAEAGAVISEFPLFTEPDAFNFPTRNRIISGISLGTVVVEATKKSGSLITARLAAEQNREVFAVPGNINSFKSIGTHTLIKQGAKLVEHARDIMEEFPYIFNESQSSVTKNKPALSPVSGLTSEESTVFDQLEPYPIHIDKLVQKLTIEPGKLSSLLLQLELKGIVQQVPGKLFSIKEMEHHTDNLIK